MTRLISIVILTLVILSCAPIPKSEKITPVQKIKTVENISYPENLHMITRSDWGWVPITGTKPIHEISKITIHHGGEFFPEDKDVVEYLIHFQAWSISTKHWIDNPYHYMIDLKGNIYETRPIQYPGDTNTSYDPTGHALICMMGNYEVQVVTEIQLKALAKLTAYLADKYNVVEENIKTHKDYVETLCPGKDLYRYFEDGSFYQNVRALRK